jgi:carbon-monoxide dehydrogenase medium subunit
MLPEFEYKKFDSLSKALHFLAENPQDCMPILGGSDLIVKLRERKIVTPEWLLDISSIDALRGVRRCGSVLVIGSCTRISDIERSVVLKESVPLLIEAAKKFGFWQLKTISTLGGNLCNASPASDFSTPLIALGARLKLSSERVNSERGEKVGERILPVEEFFEGPGKTVLAPDELLTEIIIPIRPERPERSETVSRGWSFKKLGRRNAHVLSVVNLAVYLEVRGMTCTFARVGLGSVAPTPIRSEKVERAIIGKKLTQKVIEDAALQVKQDIRPISDIRASREYREAMSVHLTKLAIMDAYRMARKAGREKENE